MSDRDKRTQALGVYIMRHGDHQKRESREIAWYADTEHKIRNTSHYKTLINKTLSCSMLLKENGQVDKVHVVKSSGTETIDNEALACIRSASPFELWGPEVAFSEGLLVEFDYPRLEVKPVKPIKKQ